MACKYHNKLHGEKCLCLKSNPTIGGGRGYEKNIPYCMGNVAKKAPPGCEIGCPVSGWTSLLQTKLILAGVC